MLICSYIIGSSGPNGKPNKHQFLADQKNLKKSVIVLEQIIDIYTLVTYNTE